MIEKLFLDYFGWVLAGVFLVLIGLAVIGMKAEYKDLNRLMVQCLADGHKEYECASLLRRGHRGGASIPIIIPQVR